MTSVCACLITRDEAAHIARCLTSVLPFVDELCVYDTGSTDETIAIVETLAAEQRVVARVARGAWRDDFSFAREQSFLAAMSEWLLWLDADDEVYGGETLRELVAAADAADRRSIFALYDTHDGGWIWRDRIVRRGSGRWEGQVHEVYRIEGSYHTRSVAAHPDAFRVRHLRRRQRPGYYLGLLRRAAEYPARTPRAMFLLAKKLLAIAEALVEAAEALEQYLAGAYDRVEGEPNVYRAKSLEWLVNIYRDLQRSDDYLRVVRSFNEYAGIVQRAVEAGCMPDPTFFRELGDFARAWTPSDSKPESIILRVDAFKGVKAGRNDPCPCHSGKKYKKCHGAATA